MSHQKFNIADVGNSIIRLEVVEGAELELEDAVLMHSSMLELSGGKRFCVLFIANTQFSVSSAARKKIASKEYSSMRYADAFVTSSLANKLTGNFFIKFNKPESPTKIFTKEEEAIEWLNDQLAKLR